ncbi:uncharacterized protein LOC135477926 [Liolophura sinensis]|uniref:uncharacterized protein LOC135477926 n=1 Tax=Liolophura sinensis TaxID=3198878 RepID=UPI00315969B9
MRCILFFALLGCILAVNGVAGSSWLLGCYYVNQTLDDGSLLAGVSVRLQTGSVVECGEACVQEGFAYMGLHSRERCACYNVTTLQTLHQQGLKQILPEYCNISCTGDGVSLPCGGHRLRHLGKELVITPVSLYLAAGPYLTGVTLQVDADWVVVHTPFAVEAVASLAGYLNISEEWAHTNKSGLEIQVSWTVGDHEEDETEEAWGPRLKSRIPYTFSQTGNYTVEVKVSNVISSISTQIVVNVINPEPKDLQLGLLTAEEYRPSCTPKKCNIQPGTAAVAVFANYTSSIEASVSVGANLTFVLEYGDDGSVYEHRPSDDTPNCEERNCTSVVQDHVFREIGVYNVTVTVSNVYNTVQEVLTVVVVNHSLSNLSMSLHEDSPRLVTPLQPVKFLLKVETASRRDTYMELFISSKNRRVFIVKEFNTSALALSKPDRAVIAASYGEGCTLEVNLDHVFLSEGHYRPVITAFNNVSNITAKSSDHVLVVQKLSVPRLHAASVTALNVPSKYHVDFEVKSRNMSLTWSILTQSMTPLHTVVDASQTWTYTFTTPGRYVVAVSASNIQGNVSTWAPVYVQVPVTGLTLVQPPQFHAPLGHTLSLSATIEGGSDVEFTWNFSDPSHFTDVIDKNSTTYANHTYFKPGKYNVSVVAQNNVSREVASLAELFIVQQRVTFVALQSTEPTALGNATIFLSFIDKGTDINFDFDFGQGKGREPGKGEHKPEGKYFVTHFFTRTGIHQVKVFAYNLVSEVTSQIDVIVEEPAPQFRIEVVDPIIANRSVVLAAMKGGDVIQRPDLIYTWYVGNQRDKMVKTRSPLLFWTFPEAGSYNVSVEAGNRLEPFVFNREVSVEDDEGQLSLHHCGVAEVNQSCRFSLLGNVIGTTNVTVKYRNDVSDAEERTLNPSGWSIVFKQSGLHRVLVRGEKRDDQTGKNKGFELFSFFIVEEVIGGLQLKGPQVVALHSLPRRYVWEALLDQGSHVIYVWALGNNRSLPTTYREYAQRFVERGTYILFLELVNDVSRVMANLTIVAQHSIVDVEAVVPAVVLHVATNLSLTVEGGREFFVHVNFGDDTEELLSSEDRGLILQTVGSQDSDAAAPEHHVFIPHLYESVGVYEISVNVSNMLSWKTFSKSARVEEPITGIVIRSNSPSVIPVGDTVEIFVTVESGTDLSFKWRFSNRPDSTSVASNASSSVANHTFSSQGTYVVSVEINNPYVQAPLVATLKGSIQVVQPVVDITLEVVNAVELINNQGNWSTEDVVINASCYDCSHVTFEFDFGDGTSRSVTGLEDSFSFMTGETTHRYTAVGVYSVSVTAFTPLNNLTSKPQLLYVQVAPRDLRLDHAIYKTRFGNDTHFVATLTQGTNVTIDWKFGDDQEKLDGGLEVTHRYLNRGSFNVSVTARNRVGSPEDSATVYVQYPIQGVDLRVNTTLVASGETVKFTATPYPLEFADDDSFVGWYIWKLDSLSSNNPQTSKNSIEYTYSYARKDKTRVTVTVTAANFVNNATSKPLDLYVLSKVTFLQMQYSGIPLLNHTLTFTMSTYSGSELNYTWDFGDGSPVVSGYVQTINHTFTRVGEYEVVGYVENALSNATVKETIFILETPCAPPQITILPHLPGSQEQYIIERSKEVKIELETKVSCSITHAMAYTWMLLNETTGEAVDISSVRPQVFRERTLYFPPRTLNYGNYTLHLEVKMNGTIVYSKVDIKLGIVASLLTSVIRGGILRQISPQDVVVLNGASSRDPDFENSTDMIYQWTCYRLKDPDEGCFAENMSSVLDPTQSILQFPGHLLSPNNFEEEFVFNLTVSKPGREPHTATQILRLSDANSPTALHIQITCPACMDGLVNNNERLAMKAVCENCGAHDELVYTWSIYSIAGQDGLRSDNNDNGGHKCEPQNIAAAPESLKAEDPEDVPKEPPATTTTTIAPPVAVENSTEIPGLFKPKEASSDGRNTRRRKRHNHDPEEPEDPIPLPQPEPGTAGSARFLGPSRRQDYVPPVPSETGSSVMDKGQFVSTISEGRDETGSTGGRSGSGFHEGVGNGRNNPGGNQNREEPPQGETVKDTEKPVQPFTPPKLLVEQHKSIFKPEAKYMKTGYNKNVFILKPGALSQGQQYIFIVQVTKKGEPLTKGESWVLVVVNQSPSRGICTVPSSQSPSFSYELEEKFQVYCKEWQDNDHGPLSYEVSYRLGLEEDEPYNLIYRGLNTKMEFRLPAGKGPEHKVFVRILISDNFGASTQACNITLKVRPREQNYGNETVEQQLYNEVSRSDSTLGVFISQKDYSNTRVFANYLTLSLNRLGPSPAATKSTRQEVRHTLLSLLNSFPIRDEYELWQTIQPVVQLTKVIDELDKRCVGEATQLLQKIATEAQVIYKNQNHGRLDPLRYIVDVSSNIMAASSLVRTSSGEQMSTIPPRVTTTKADESVASVTWVIDTMLQGQLQSRYVGEEAIQWSSSYISVFANRYGTMKGPLIQMGDASCSLPTDMSLVLATKSADAVQLSTSSSLHLPATSENCYEAHMITFHEDPFSLHVAKNKDIQVNSKVTSLKVMDCHGEEVKVKNLSQNNMVKIEIPQKEPEKEPSCSHTLNKWQMNVHQFNNSEKNVNQSLHIQVELVPVGRGRLFSIAALIRMQHGLTQVWCATNT